MVDCIIIGSGAAGVSAALTLKALGKDILWLGDPELSVKIDRAEKIENYPGLPSVSGEEMKRAFLSQISSLGLEIKKAQVTGVYAMGSYFSVLCDKEQYEGKSVILATGVESVKPIEGELEFLGRGVSYCATCDGNLYRGKTIAVVCLDRSLEHEAKYLVSLAGKTYYFPLFQGAGKIENCEVVSGMPRAVVGNRRVEKLVLKDGELVVDGVFFLKTAISPSALVGGLKTENGHVVVDRHGRTNLKGLFAAGDCTGRPYQYAKAVGEGNVAAHAVVEYLNS